MPSQGSVCSCGPTIMPVGANAPGMALLRREVGGEEMPHLAKRRAVSILPPAPAIVRLKN